MNVFVSYSRRDQDFALRMVQALRDWGHDPWLDLERIPKGANWPDEIDKGLDAADVVVGILSENSMASGMVKNEWDYALINEKPLIPVRLRPTKVSHRYVRLNYIDCTNDEEIGLQSLQKALQSPKTSVVEDNPVSLVPSRTTKPKTIETAKQRVSNRTAMLNKVHDFWIKGVLEPAKLGDAWLVRDVVQRPKAVEPEIKRELHNPDFDTFSLGSDAKIVDVFHRMGNELLILGVPGSGKTMTLLELARDLIAEAQADDTQPLPVVFNLVSWAEKHPEKLEDWLIEHLFLDYSVPHKVGKSWIENGNLMFLFDGLDEVLKTYRDSCVTAINAFWQNYDQIDNGIAVCSRIADYNALTTTLHLENAIMLDMLTPAQAEDYLAKLGKGWDELRTAIPEDVVLRDFASSPLLLNFMMFAYRDTPREQIIGLSEPDQKRQLFDRYVVRRLHEGTTPDKYPNTKTRHYLRWLACKMVEHNAIPFQIEGLQPDWLDTEQQRRQYRYNIIISSGLVFGLVGGPLVALIFGLASGSANGLYFGLIIGLFGGLISGLLYGLIRGQAGALDKGPIKIIEKLNWSWQKARDGLSMGLIGGFIVGLVGGLRFGLVGGLFGGLFLGLRFGLVNSSRDQRINPNEGVRNSLRSALFFGLSLGLLVGLIVGLVLGLVVGPITGLFGAIVGGLIGELLFVPIYGGKAVIQHFFLRLMLYQTGASPLNYAEFLDYGVSRQLLRRVGGGYIFRHRMLMEYFAEKEH